LKSSLGPNVVIATLIAPNLWPIAVDPAGFDLALLNVVLNARDAMPEGGIITIAAENMILARPDAAPHLEGDFAAISITDTGIGIPADMMAKVFDPFFTTKAPDKGTGLGLSQVHGFAHQSGGGVVITSTVGKGATVTLYFPRASAEETASAPSRSAPQRGQGRILVVDDNVDVANVSAGLLRQLGYVVTTVNGAAAALDALKSGSGWDLVLSDIVMPGAMNGIELTRFAKKLYPDLPFVLVTGYSEAAIGAGSEFTILHKPFTQAELGAAVGTALGLKASDNLIRFPGARSAEPRT
jgi:CheY-like chemotaxis protein